MAASGNMDSRRILRGGCTVCACTSYDGGLPQKKCIHCCHPPGKHQNMSSTSSTVGSSVSTSSVASTSGISHPTSLASDGGETSLTDDSAIFMSPVYQCAFQTSFDPNTGDQHAFCDQHRSIEAAQSYAYGQPQQSLPTSINTVPARSTTTGQGWFPKITGLFGSLFHHGVRSDGDAVDDDDMIDVDSASMGSSQLADLHSYPVNTSAPSAPLPSSVDLPFPSDTTTSHSLMPGMDGLTSAPQLKLKKSQSSLPRRAPSRPAPHISPPVQAWLPTTSRVVSQPNSTASLSISGQQVCKLPGCSHPVYFDQDTEITHDFCRRAHAKQYQQQNGIAPHPRAATIPPHLQCETAGCPNPKHPNPEGGYFNYCSKSCRNRGASASTPNLQNASGFGTCSLPGCILPKYEDPANGRVHDFCSRKHAAKARAQGIQAVSTSSVNIRQANQSEFTTVSQKFTAAWKVKKGPCPKVDFVFVVSNSTLITRWSTYRQQLRYQAVEEYYHGTKLTCNLARALTPCNSKTCGICGISSTGLDRRCIRNNIDFQRFGHGFYLAPNSSKCHDYTQGAHGYRAMLLCDVCPGRKYKLTMDNEDLQVPPTGYDSVLGEVGGSLNYTEIVVYNPDAVVPRYIVMYRKDGTNKIAE